MKNEKKQKTKNTAERWKKRQLPTADLLINNTTTVSISSKILISIIAGELPALIKLFSFLVIVFSS